MNLRAKLVFSVGLLGLLCLLLPSSLRADTIYTYTGNPFTVTAFCPPICSISGYFTVDSPLAADLDFTNVISPNDYDFTNGASHWNSTDSIIMYFNMATDANGNPSAWQIALGHRDAYSGDWSYVYTVCDDPNRSVAYRTFDAWGWMQDAENNNDPGVWSSASVPSEVPEPSTILLFVTGLPGLWALAARRKRHAPPTSC